MDWMWEWKIHPTTYNLYQRYGDAWRVRTPVLTQHTYVAYRLQEGRRVAIDPDLLPPATPSIDSSQEFLIIQLPISNVMTIAPPTDRIQDDLLEWLSTSPVEWAIPLWHQI